MKKKTLNGWQKSNKDLDEYLFEPCEIDEEMFNYVMEVISPYYIGHGLGQGGDPVSSYESYDEDFKRVMTYVTVYNINDKYFYLGVLPEFKQ